MPKRYHNRHLINRVTSFFRPPAPPAALEDPPNAARIGELHALFWATNDLQTAKDVFALRFGVDPPAPGAAEAPDWDLAGLRAAWRHLETLPPAHVAKNTSLRLIERSKNDARENGAFSEAFRAVSMKYNPTTLRTEQVANVQQGDTLFGLNRFKKTLRHEVGHAVDHLRKYSWYFNPAGWAKYNDAQILTIFIDGKCRGSEKASTRVLIDAAFPTGIPVDGAAQRAALDTALAAALAAPPGSPLRDAATSLGLITGGALAPMAIANFRHAPLMRALAATGAKLYYRDDGGASEGLLINGRIYQRINHQNQWKWMSYLASDRQYKVSNYAYASPEEWFAEHYAAFYSDVSSQVLEKQDPEVYRFFKDVVDNDGKVIDDNWDLLHPAITARQSS